MQPQRTLIDGLIAAHGLERYVLWYYTPMAPPFTRHLTPAAIVYDCMDELSGFLGAPPGLLDAERALMGDADLVLHRRAQPLRSQAAPPSQHPSDSRAASMSRTSRAPAHPRVDPADQRHIAHPRIGFFGVLDERFDIELLRRRGGPAA